MPPHLKSEREEMMVRSQLGLGRYDRVMAEGGAARTRLRHCRHWPSMRRTYPLPRPKEVIIVSP